MRSACGAGFMPYDQNIELKPTFSPISIPGQAVPTTTGRPSVTAKGIANKLFKPPIGVCLNGLFERFARVSY